MAFEFTPPPVESLEPESFTPPPLDSLEPMTDRDSQWLKLNAQREAARIEQDVIDDSSAVRRVVADPAIALAKGVISVPEAAVGLADIVSNGRAGKAVEDAGFKFREAKDILSSYQTAEQQFAQGRVAQAKGFLPTVKALAENPTVAAESIVESLPLMFGGGALSQAALKGIAKIGPKFAAWAAGASAPVIAGAAGEGLVGAGSAAENIRQQSPDRLLTWEQAGYAAASGVGTAAFGALSGKFAQKLGLEDIQTALARGGAQAAQKAALPKFKAVIAGALQEGALEELPQSAQEQMFSNLALGKPWDEGLAEAAAQGFVAGAAMGGGVQLVSGRGQPPTAPTPPPLPTQPAPTAPAAPTAVPPAATRPTSAPTVPLVAPIQQAKPPTPTTRTATAPVPQAAPAAEPAQAVPQAAFPPIMPTRKDAQRVTADEPVSIKPTEPLPPNEMRMVSAGAKILAKQGFDPETAAEFAEHFVRSLRGEPASMEVFRADLVNNANQIGLVNPNTARTKNTSVEGLVGSGVPRERAEQVARENALFNEARARQVTLSNREVLKRLPRIYPAKRVQVEPTAAPTVAEPKAATPKPRRVAITPETQAAAPAVRASMTTEVSNLSELINQGGGQVRITDGGVGVDFDKFALSIDGDEATVGYVELKDKSQAGSGIGKRAYIALGRALLEKGITLKSSGALLGPGHKLWTSLVRDGYAIREGSGYSFTGNPLNKPPQPRRVAITPEAQAAAPKRQQALPEAFTLPEPLEGQPYDTRLETRPEASMPAIPAGELGIERGRVSPVDPDLAAAVEDIRGGYAERTARELEGQRGAADRIRDDLPEAKPILDEIEKITAEARKRHSAMPEGQTKYLTSELDMLDASEKARLNELQGMIRPKSQAEAMADVQRKRAARQPSTQPPYAPQKQAPVEVLRNQPPGTPAQVAEGKPGEVSEAAGEGAPEKRDKSKPEQMTPEEWGYWYEESVSPKLKSRKVKLGQGQPKDVRAFNAGLNDFAERARLAQPLSASAVDTYGIKLPPGYIREGDLYVYRPEVKPEEGRGETAKAFSPDDALIMHSPHSGEDVDVTYRGPLGDKSVVWTGRSQMSVPTGWLRRKGEPLKQPENARPADQPSSTPISAVPVLPEPDSGLAEQKEMPKTKAGLIEELVGKKPEGFSSSAVDSRVRWDNKMRTFSKFTKAELESRVLQKRELDQKLKEKSDRWLAIGPLVKAQMQAAGNSWRSEAKRIAVDHGISEYVTFPENSLGEEAARLSGLLAEKGYSKLKQAPSVDVGEQQVLDEISKLKSVTGPLSQSERIDLNELRLSAQNKTLSRLSQAYLENLEERAGGSGEQMSLGGAAEEFFVGKGVPYLNRIWSVTKVKGDKVQIRDSSGNLEWVDKGRLQLAQELSRTAAKERKAEVPEPTPSPNFSRGAGFYILANGKDTGEGPFDSREEAQEFADSELGVPFTIEEFNPNVNSLGQTLTARPAPSLSKMQVEQAVRELFGGNTPPNFQVTHNYGKTYLPNIPLGVFDGVSLKDKSPSAPTSGPVLDITLADRSKVGTFDPATGRITFTGQPPQSGTQLFYQESREVRGWYDPATGAIWLNAAYLRSPQEARAVFIEEAFHAIQNDKAVQQELSRLVASLTPEQLSTARAAYGNISDEQLQMEAVADILEKQQLTQEQRGILARLWDAVLGAVQRLYGKFTGKVFTERDAQDILAKALKAAAVGKRSLKGGGEVYADGDAASVFKYSKVPTGKYSPQQLAAVSNEFRALASNPKAFKYPTSNQTDIAKIAEEMAPGEVKVSREESEDGGSLIKLTTKNGSIYINDVGGDRPYLVSTDAGSAGVKGGLGTLLYQIAFTWAHNNGKTVVASPSLSEIAILRRTSNMLSSALRFGTTDHLLPDPSQRVEWVVGDTWGNIARLALKEYELVNAATGGLEGAPSYNPETLSFGRPDRMQQAVSGVDRLAPGQQEQLGKYAGIGSTTLQRAVFTESALQRGAIPDGKVRQGAVGNPEQAAHLLRLMQADDVPQLFYGVGSPQNQLDQKYFEAIQRGDMREVQALVDEAARGAGYNVGPVWHGTPFGDFTVFDEKKSPDYYTGKLEDDTGGNYYPGAIWVSTSEQVADEYSSGVFAPTEARGEIVGERRLPFENLPDGTKVWAYRNHPKDTAHVSAILQPDGTWIAPAEMLTPTGKPRRNVQWQVELPNGFRFGGLEFDGITPQAAWDLAQKKYNAPMTVFKKSRTMRLFAKFSNPKVTDMEGGRFRRMGSKAAEAKHSGHDALIVKNVRDPGANPARSPIADSIAVFSSSQLKSADPITYDDSGNIIPLSQRFQQESPDIRYSLGERVKGPQEDNLGAKYTDAIRASESSGSRQDFLRGTDAQIEAAIIGADVSAMVRQGVGYEGRPSGAVRGLRSGTESAAGKAVPKVRVFISTDALDSTARKNSEILASRIFPAESGTQAAALSDMDEGDFVLTAARRTPFFVTIFSAEGEKSPLARTQTLADGTPAIIFNTTNLGKFNLQDAATAAQFDGVLSEELIHVAAISVTSQKEAQDVWASLSDKEKKAAERSYNRRRNKDALSDYELGHEYLRMVIQERMFGKTTEQVELRITEPVKKFLRKLLNFIKEAFGKKPENDIARQLVSRIESALNGETPRQYSIIPSGTSLATNISQSDATEVQGRAIEPSVIAAAGRAVADLGRQTVEEYEQAGRELEGLAYESKAFRQARSELNNLVSLHEGRLRQLPQDRVTDDMRANIRDGVSIENGQIVVGDELVTKLAQMGVQARPELVKAMQAEVYFEQQARRLVDNLGKLATLKELRDYYTRIKAPADEIKNLDKLIAAKEKVVANLTPVTTNRGRGQQSIGERASEITRANASKVELQSKRDALALEPVQEFFGKGIAELRDLSEKAKAAADLTRALMDSTTSISEVARLGEIYDKWASFDATVKDALKKGTLTDEQRVSVLTSLQQSFNEFDEAKLRMDDLLNSEEQGLLKSIRQAEADIADAKVTSGLADILVADALKAAKGEMGLTGTVGDAANIANLEASTGAITTLAMNLGRTIDQNRWLYDFLVAPGSMPAFGANVAQSLGISETALREILKVVQQSPSLASAIVTLTDDAAAKLAASPPNQMQSIAQLATSGNPQGMALAANLTSQIVQQANAQGTKANAARQAAARQLAQSVLRLRTLQQGQALFNQTGSSPAFQQLRSAVAAGASEAQKMVVLGPTGPVLRGFKSAAKEYQPELKIDVDGSPLELSKTREKVWKYLQNAEQYVADYEAAAAAYAANPANPSPSQLGFDVADYNGLKFAIENQIVPMFLNMGDMDDAARAAQYLTPVLVRKFMKLPAFLGQIFLQYEQLGKMIGGFAGNIFRQQIAKYKRGYLNGKRVDSQFQDLPRLQSAAMQSHNIKNEDAYRRIFNEMAHYGRLFGTPLRVGFKLPVSNQVVTKADMEFLKRTLAFMERLRREVNEVDPVTGVRYMRGGKEVTRKGAYVGDVGMSRHLNRGATRFIADVTNAYAATPKGFTATTDLSASSQDGVAAYWNQHLNTLKDHVLNSLRTDRSFKQSAEMAAAEKKIAARWLAGNMDQVNSVQDLVDLIAAEIPTTSGKNPLDTAREGLNNELLQYVAHAERIKKERAEDNAKTSGLSIALSSENEYTKPAAYLELPSEYYDYGAVSSVDRITAQARANHSTLIDFANSIRLAITELRNRLDRLKLATTDKERDLILENYKGNQQEMEDVLELLTASLKNFEDSYRAGGPDLVPTRLGQKLLKATVGSVLAKVEIGIRNLSQGQLQVFTNLRAMNYMSARLAAWKALSNVPRGLINTGYLVARNIAGFADRRLGRDPQFQRTLKGAVDVLADGIFKSAQLALLKPRVGAANVRASFERVNSLGFDTSNDWWETAKQAWAESGQFRNQLEEDEATKNNAKMALHFLDRLANTGLDAINAFVRGSVLESSDTNMNALSLGLVGNMEKRLEEVAMVFGKRLTDLGITRIDPTDKRAVLQANEWLPSLNQQTATNSLGEIRKFLESSASSEGFSLERNLLQYYQDKMAGRPAKIFNQRTFDAVQRSMIAENNAALPTNRASAGQASTLWRTLLTLQGYPADAFLKLLRVSTGGSRDRKTVLQAASKISLALGIAALAIILQGAGDAGAELWKRKIQGKRADRPTPLDADFYTDLDHLNRAMGRYLMMSAYYLGNAMEAAYGWVDGRTTIDPTQRVFAIATASQIIRDIVSGAKIAKKGGSVSDALEPLRKSMMRLTFAAPELEYLLGRERDNTEAARRGITENAKAKGFDLPSPGFSGTVGLTNIKRKAISQAVSDMDIAKRKGDTEGYNKAKAEAQKQIAELEAYYLKQRLDAGDSPEVAAKTAKASVWGDYQENNPVTAALGGKRPTAEQYKQLVESSTGERGEVIRQGIKAWQDGAQALFGKPGNITKEDVAENRPSGTVKEPSYGRVSLTGGVSGRMRSVGTALPRGRRAKIRRVSLTGRRRRISPLRGRRKKIRRVRLTA